MRKKKSRLRSTKRYVGDSMDAMRISNDYTTAIERRLNPKEKEDFDLLSLELVYWQNKKLAEIEEKNVSDEIKSLLRLNILSKQTKLIGKIETLKKGVLVEKKQQRLESFLQKKSEQPVWDFKDGKQIQVETIECRNNAHLISLYHKLNKEDSTADERKETLEAVKRVTEKYPITHLAKDICDLIDREMEMINREMTKMCSSLRLRLSNQFLNYLERYLK